MSERHGHGHGHGHGTGHGHGHAVSANADKRWLSIALGLLVVFMCGEVIAGLVANSLALISDAAHMLTDAASIVLALVAIRLAARPAQGRYTYGFQRTEILSAQANGITLLILGAWLTYEAINRLLNPPEVEGMLVLVTALVGVAVNVAATWALSKANRSSLNVEGAFQHVLNDLYAFIATAVAGALVMLTGLTQIDAVASLIVVALMVRAGIGLVRDSGRIFLEAAPAGVDPDVVGQRMVSLPGVIEVHDLHVWEITSNRLALSAHVLVDPAGDCHALRRDVERFLASEYSITHNTLQVDHISEDTLSQLGADSQLLVVGAEHCQDSHGPIHREPPPGRESGSSKAASAR